LRVVRSIDGSLLRRDDDYKLALSLL